jgi:hypothetical protein
VRSSLYMRRPLWQVSDKLSNFRRFAWENDRMRKGVKRALGLGMLAGAAYAVWRALEQSRADTGLSWQPRPFPYPPEPVETPVKTGAPESPDATEVSAWVDAAADGCPASHPVKAKLASGIFHQPGGANYARTLADRCYLSAEAAEADGLRPAKR